MKDYNIEDPQRILKTCNPNEINMVNHVLDKWFNRGYNFAYIFDCLLNKIPLAIIKQKKNRFKIIYPHETIKSQDLYIIIEIEDDKKILIITVYSFDKRRREHEKERK